MRIGKGALGIAIEELSIRMRRGGIEVPPVLLDVLAMVALRVGQTEESLLEPVIATIPQRDREIEEAITVGQAGDAVLTPAIGACVGMLERERLPGIPSGRIVLADRAPLPAREIGPHNRHGESAAGASARRACSALAGAGNSPAPVCRVLTSSVTIASLAARAGNPGDLPVKL